MRARCFALVLVLALLSSTAVAQDVPIAELGAWRDTLSFGQPQPFQLRPFVLPGSERIYFEGARLDTTQYRLQTRYGLLWVDALTARGDAEIIAVYRTYPFDFKDAYRRRRVIRAEDDTTGTLTVVEAASSAGFDPFSGFDLQRSGSITRGISAGNNRDVTVESGLRLQLAGEVADGVNIQAVLTDENTPILPEGTTQRLNEFDRVFIEIAARPGTAQLGDVDLRFQQSEFAKFSRKVQGISLFGDLPDPESPVLGGGNMAVAGATARGIYRTQEIEPIEGVQGPYRLEGAAGERFIIVIPGSEAVYLDGRLMERGESNAYVIDYATGEITFTANQLITADNRLTVEFQYSAGLFTRSLLATDGTARFWQRPDGSARARFGATFLREADNREFNADFGLTPADSLLIVGAGDATATRSGAEPVEFDPEAPYVQYLRQDTTLVSGQVDTIFVALDAEPLPGMEVFRVRFSRIAGGSYVRVGRTVNGILYEYRGPGMGDYAPIRLLPRPKQQRLVDFRGGLSPIKHLDIFGEWARSLNDENRLSSLDSADDQGDAYLAGLRLHPISIMVEERKFGTLAAQYRRRFTGDNFASFDRTRPIEFGRRWNLTGPGIDPTGGTVQRGDEVIDEGDFTFAFTPRSRLQAELGRLNLDDAFQSSRQAVFLQTSEENLPQFDYRLEYIQSKDSTQREHGQWLRQLGSVEKSFLSRRLVPRFEVEHENRRQRIFGTDSLTARSLGFVEYRPGLAWRTEQLEIGAQFKLRTEDLPAAGDLRDASTAWTVQAPFRYRPNQTFNTAGSLGYRVKRFTDSFRIEQKRQDAESVVLRWNGGFAPLKRAMETDWFYEALTERTPTLQEIYVRTGPELGQFVWEDANGDGIIQVDEFIPERVPDEGTYVRTFIPSDSLSSVINVQARASLDLDPARLWRRSGVGWQKLLSQISTRTAVQVEEKSKEPDLAQIYLLNLSRFRSPVHTLAGRLRISQDVYLFRTASRYGIDLSFNQVRALSQLAAGQETRFVNLWRFDGKYRVARTWSTRFVVSWEENRTDSEQFASRRYDIEGVTVEPEVTFNPSSQLQFGATASFAQKQDRIGDRRARVFKIPLDARLSLIRRLQLTGRVELARVDLEGEAVGLAQFELTDGRGPGTSYLWSLNGQYRLSRLLRATLAYNGRAPADAPVLHTVRVQLSASF